METNFVEFKKFTKEHYERFVKWGYDPTGSCINRAGWYRKRVLGSTMHFYGDEPMEIFFRDRVLTRFRKLHKPLTFSLSGGLDSSYLFALFLQSGSKADYEIISYDNEDDLEHLRILLDSLGVKKEPVIAPKIENPSDNDLLRMMKWQFSPMDLGSMQCNFSIISNTKGKVLVTGDGADEIFGGYTRHQYYDTSETDVNEELFYYHIPRVWNMCAVKGLCAFSPYLWLIGNQDKLFYPGKRTLKEWALDYLPTEIINRKKRPLKSDDAKIGLEYRSRLVNIWRESEEDYERVKHVEGW